MKISQYKVTFGILLCAILMLILVVNMLTGILYIYYIFILIVWLLFKSKSQWVVTCMSSLISPKQ